MALDLARLVADRLNAVPLADLPRWAERPALPAGWKLMRGGKPNDDGAWWENRGLGLTVIESFAVEGDDRIWHHVSVSRRSRCPDWADMCLVHRLFIGEDHEAYQVHVPKSRWISIHPHCLHLWAAYGEPDGVLPPFERGGRTI